MSKLINTFLRAVVYKFVFQMPWWVLIPIIALIAFFAHGAFMDFVGHLN